MLKKYSIPIIMWLVFKSIAVILWQTLDNIFYLFNFSYIGTSIAIGLFLFARKQKYARHVIQFAVGLYMLGYLGFLQHENMQIEGFWYYLFLGVFEAATIHYAVAKIFGPFIFGRGWCGYACWTAMILDLLPFKTPASSRRKWGFIRYIVFVGSLIFVSSLFLLHVQNIEQIMWYSFLIGNLIYYVVGIALAFICKDNPIGDDVENTITNIKEAKENRLDKTSRYIGRNVIEICAEADITFLALHGGEGENGQLQATLDLFGIKYTGSGYLGSALAMNKGLTKSVFMQKNINTPSGELYKNEKDALAWNMFPCIVKPCSGGSSVGVSKVENADQYKKAVKEALKYEDEIVVEQFVTGREFSVGLIGGKALPPIEIAPKSGMYDYAAKYQAGATVETCPADIDEETDKKLRGAATEAYEALHLESYARIDFLLDKGGFTYCLEANTLPGMTPTSLLPQEAAVEGISYPDLCEKIIEISLAKYPEEKSDF